MTPLTIGQVAKRAGVGVETIRFYEREGLMEEPDRRPSGYRQYPDVAVDRLQFIRRAKELGFSLREIRELLALRLDQSSRCSEVKRLAEAKISDVEAKIRSLKRIRTVLRNLTEACDEQRPTGECPVLDALSREWNS